MTSEPRVPLVSVVVPVYNHERYIVRCLDSIFDQAYRALQLIIIDDGSRDASPHLIKEYLQRRGETPGIEVIFRARENRGAHNTINEGLESAAGEYIAILNSDDFYHAQRIEKCVSACESSGADLVISYVEPVDENGEALPITHEWRAWYNADCISELAIAPTTGFVFLENNLAVSSGNLFFRRSLYREIGAFKDFVLAHDLDFVLRALLVTEPYLIKEKLYFYRLHGSNTISEQKEREVAELDRIWTDYVRAAAVRPPRNPLAPCHWYWPVSYEWSLGRNSYLVRARNSLLQRPESFGEDASVWRRGMSSLASSTDREVTVVTHQLSLSGAPRVALEVAAMLRERGVKVSVLSISEGPLQKDFESIGAEVKVLQTRFAERLSDRIIRYLQTEKKGGVMVEILRLLARGLRGFGKIPLIYDVPFLVRLLVAAPSVKKSVFANSFSAWPIVLPLGMLKSFERMVWFIHESCDPNLLLPGRRLKTAFREFARKPWLTFAFGSDATRRIWAGAGVDGVTRYWSGLHAAAPSAKIRPPGSGIREILSVGTASGRKGTRLLIEAFALAIRERWVPEEVTLTIVGVEEPSGDRYAADLVNRVQQLEFGGRVRLVPPVEAGALNRYYQRADLYVQSSNMECLPLALLTAMDFVLPIVTTDADGCREAIVDGVCGRTIAPRSVRLLARTIADVIADPERGFAYGQAARDAFVKHFSLEATEQALLETILG